MNLTDTPNFTQESQCCKSSMPELSTQSVRSRTTTPIEQPMKRHTLYNTLAAVYGEYFCPTDMKEAQPIFMSVPWIWSGLSMTDGDVVCVNHNTLYEADLRVSHCARQLRRVSQSSSTSSQDVGSLRDPSIRPLDSTPKSTPKLHPNSKARPRAGQR